jgi:hypothetical protein
MLVWQDALLWRNHQDVCVFVRIFFMGTVVEEVMTWPYDAVEDDPLTAIRIPVVESPYPTWAYLVAFDGSSPERPTDREALQIHSFLEEYVERWYTDHWKMRLAERPFDIDGGANGMVFYKWAENDWGYRQRTWTMGPTYWPGPPSWENRLRSYSLEELLDHRHHSVRADEVSQSWLDWKANHPEAFGND